MRTSRTVSALLLVAVLATARTAVAASRVTVVCPSSPDAAAREATTRLEAELRATGFEVVSVDAAPGSDPRAEVETTRLGPGVIATIAIRSTERGAEADVWVADHLSEKTLVRRVDVAAAGGDAASTLAIRAVELLRASLLETTSPAATHEARPVPTDVARWIERPPAPSRRTPLRSPPAPEPTARPGADPPPRESPPARSSLALAPALRLGVHGLDGVGPMLSVSTPAPLGTLVRLSLLPSLLRPVLRGQHGVASVSEELAVLDLAYPLGPRSSRLLPVLSAGAGASHFRVQGAGDVGYRGTARTAWSFVADAGLSLLVRLGARLALEGGFHAQLLAPQPVVQIAGQELSRAGLPVLQMSLGLVTSL